MFRTTRRIAPAVAALALAAAAVPAGASAHTSWFGSSLNHEPANAGNSCEDNGLTGYANCTHVGSYYPGTSGVAKAPKSGTIVKFKVMAQAPTTMTFKVASLKHLSSDHRSAQGKVTAKGRTVQVQGPTEEQIDDGTYQVETFKAHLKVHKGQYVAVDSPNNTAEYCSNGTPYQLLFGPRLKVGNPFTWNQGTDDCLLLVKAIVKS